MNVLWQRGGSALHLPTIECVPFPYEANLSQLNQYDWIIFVSVYAVLQSLAWIPHIPTKTQIATLGAGTAHALYAAGVEKIIYPADEWTSEGLLKLPEFQDVNGKKILLIRGEGGRDVLEKALIDRGAFVDHWIVYRRIIPICPQLDEYLLLLRKKKIDIIVCTSGESLHNLLKIVGPENHPAVFETILITVSERLVTLAKELGFQRVFLAENASHDAILRGINHVRE